MRRTNINWDEQIKQAQEEIKSWPKSVDLATRLDQSFSAVAENYIYNTKDKTWHTHKQT